MSQKVETFHVMEGPDWAVLVDEMIREKLGYLKKKKKNPCPYLGWTGHVEKMIICLRKDATLKGSCV